MKYYQIIIEVPDNLNPDNIQVGVPGEEGTCSLVSEGFIQLEYLPAILKLVKEGNEE